MIQNICEKISSYIAQELKLDNDKKSVINYGVFSFIQMGSCLALVIIFGFVFKVVVEALIISFTISILRKSSGGAHASSPEGCAIIGTISSVGMGVISKYIHIGFSGIILIGVIVFSWSYYIVYKLAPVDSVAKPIRNIEKRKKLNKNSIVILSIYLIITMIDLIYSRIIMNYIVLVYSLCIYMGLLWQVFTLTRYGHTLMARLDKFFK